MVSARVCAGNLPSNASDEQLCQPRETLAEAASVGKVDAESPDRFRGLGRVDRPALVVLDLVDAESQSALTQTPTARPDWVDGTLPGTMAGKRPAPRPTRLGRSVLLGSCLAAN
jgi:hypothetical protein